MAPAASHSDIPRLSSFNAAVNLYNDVPYTSRHTLQVSGIDDWRKLRIASRNDEPISSSGFMWPDQVLSSRPVNRRIDRYRFVFKQIQDIIAVKQGIINNAAYDRIMCQLREGKPPGKGLVDESFYPVGACHYEITSLFAKSVRMRLICSGSYFPHLQKWNFFCISHPGKK